MKRTYLLILSGIIFCFCSAMSRCKVDTSPGPVTIVEGTITDASTGKPVPNLQLNIKSFDYTIGNDSRYTEHTTTKSDGTYYLKFTPTGAETYNIFPGTPYDGDYPIYPNNIVYLGIDNIINLQLPRYVILTVHLIDNSRYNKELFSFNIGTNSDYSVTGFTTYKTGKIDTTFTSRLPYLTNYTIASAFFNDLQQTDPTAVVYTQHLYIGKADTSITITNP